MFHPYVKTVLTNVKSLIPCPPLSFSFEQLNSTPEITTCPPPEVECKTLQNVSFFLFLTVSGPKQCITSCLDYAGGCFDGSRTQICASDKLSLGTTHCGSVVGKWEGSRGIGMLIRGGKRVLDVFYRGCINCAGK